MYGKYKMDFFKSIAPKEESSQTDVMLWYAALLSSVAGVENLYEILGALACHGIAYYNDGKGPSVIYNYLSGSQLHKGKYIYIAIPLAANVNDIKEPKDTQIAHGLAFSVGFLSSYFKFV